MTPELAAFSDWVLAILPRLFVFPGGLWMLVGLAVIEFAWAGRESLRSKHWIAQLSQVNLGAAACAWAALALLPLPGTQPLPTPVDRWALVALLAVSLLLDLENQQNQQSETRHQRTLAGAGITLALLAPLASGQALLVSEGALGMTWAARLGAFAVGLGIATLLLSGDRGIGANVRGLAWLAMGLAPLWPLQPDSWLTPTIVVFLVAGAVWRGTAIRAEEPASRQQVAAVLAIQWLPALGSLLVALLFWW